MKILVVSGFLGAGKTTFIKTMSDITKKDFCVLENEYAQADIDKAILSQDTELNIWELTENCICCSGKQDFATSILTISNTIDPEFLIVEPTGVAKLSSILANISGIQYDRILLLKPLTILDGTCFHRQKKEFADIYLDQITSSDQIIISKMEHMDYEDREAIKQEILKINPNAQVFTEHYSGQPEEWWQSLLKQNLDGTPDCDSEDIETNLENMTLLDVSVPTPVHLISFLEMITFGVFGNICRAKGFLPCGKTWLRFDLVDKVYSITGSEIEEEARAVFIGKDLKRGALREVLESKYRLWKPKELDKKTKMVLPIEKKLRLANSKMNKGSDYKL